MTKSLTIAFLLLASITSLASADDKKDEPKCMLVKAAGNDVSLEVHIKPSKMFGETNCRIDSRKAAEKWVAENNACKPGQAGFDYTVMWGDKAIDLHGFCPSK